MKRHVVAEYDSLLKLPVPREQLHSLTFAVKPQNIDTLESIVQAISNPESERYGSYLSKKEIVQLTRNEVAVRQILDELEQWNQIQIVERSEFDEYIVAEAPLSVWEEVFRTKFYGYRHPNWRDEAIARAEEYFLPDSIRASVSHIFHLADFPPQAKSTARMVQVEEIKDFHGYVTPQLLRQHYNITTTRGNNLTSQAVYEIIQQTASLADLSVFLQQFHLPAQTTAAIYGGHVNDAACSAAKGGLDNCIEANLDLQYIIAIGEGVPTIYHYWTGVDPWLDWLLALNSGRFRLADVYSISYISYEYQFSTSYMQTWNNEMLKLAARGVTVVAASGDDGVSGYHLRDRGWRGYYPMFPASSPYVLTIGGTAGPQMGAPEVACQIDNYCNVTSGGGFSRLAATPTYQNEAVGSYFAGLSLQQQPVSGYNAAGRGYPDISALATNYLIVADRKLISVAGTSASAPVVAGMISLLNSQLLSQGRPKLGWMHPLLYQNADRFVSDVVQGDNKCSADPARCSLQGFYATRGWDPVTGLGVLDFDRLQKFLIGTPTPRPTESPPPVRRVSFSVSYTFSGLPLQLQSSSDPFLLQDRTLERILQVDTCLALQLPASYCQRPEMAIAQQFLLADGVGLTPVNNLRHRYENILLEQRLTTRPNEVGTSLRANISVVVPMKFFTDREIADLSLWFANLTAAFLSTSEEFCSKSLVSIVNISSVPASPSPFESADVRLFVDLLTELSEYFHGATYQGSAMSSLSVQSTIDGSTDSSSKSLEPRMVAVVVFCSVLGGLLLLVAVIWALYRVAFPELLQRPSRGDPMSSKRTGSGKYKNVPLVQAQIAYNVPIQDVAELQLTRF